MKKNIGIVDRVLRFIISLIFFVIAWVYSSWIALAIALFTLYEALASWCVMYQLFGWNSCPIDKDGKH